jgi:hypothetical protein
LIIFGWGGGKLKDKGAVWPAVCPNCHNQVLLHYTTVNKSIRIYFVPIIPYGTKHYLMCPICSKGRQLNDQGLMLVRQAQQLMARARLGEITDEQYRFELDRLRNPNAAALQPGAMAPNQIQPGPIPPTFAAPGAYEAAVPPGQIQPGPTPPPGQASPPGSTGGRAVSPTVRAREPGR